MDSEVREEVRSVASDALDKGGASWAALADAGLLALAAPEAHGGEGLGLGEVGVVLHEVGRRALDLPVWDTLACGLLTLARASSEEVQATYVPQVVAGKLLLAAALNEPGNALPTKPATTLVDGKVTGHKIDVSVLDGTTLLLVSTDAGVALVDPEGAGVTATPNYSSRSVPVNEARGLGETGYRFDGAPALAVLGENAADVLREHAIAGLLLLGDGLVAGALDLTAGYIRERVQFGRKLAEFQAVAVQIADVFVVARMAALAAEGAAWRVAEGLPAADDLAVGAAWFTDRVPAALQTCH
ncbi:MAG: acyl-CoA dehydrogenase family protein, partial [Marmoricola sp.]